MHAYKYIAYYRCIHIYKQSFVLDAINCLTALIYNRKDKNTKIIFCSVSALVA